MTALDETPATGSIWCGAVHPTAYLVICRRVRHSIDVLHSPTETGLDDWAGPVRVSPPTTSNKETRNG